MFALITPVRVVLLATVIFMLGSAVAAPAQTTWYVDDDAPLGGDGQTWDTAYKYLQEALFDASGDPAITDIRVAQGTYKPDQDEAGNVTPGDREATFQLLNGLALQGGYAGITEPDPDDRDIELYVTILSGDIGTPDDPNDNSYHVVTGSGCDATAILEGFTVTRGYASGNYHSDQDKGAGMYNNSGSPTVRFCLFTLNSTRRYLSGIRGRQFEGVGGAMYNRDAHPVVSTCTFTSNESLEAGAGVYNLDSHPILTDCRFTANRTYLYGPIGGGGGMYNFRSNPTLTRCTFEDNWAWIGAGMSNYTSDPALTDCEFTANLADGDGAGMYNADGSDPVLLRCSFTGNEALGSGGGMYNSPYYTPSNPLLERCIFAGNTARTNGGGLYNYRDCSPVLRDCVFEDNAVSNWYGGGVYNSGSTAVYVNCVFHRNSAVRGAGMYNWSYSSYLCAPLLIGCVFGENVGTEHGGAMCNASHDIACRPTVVNCVFGVNAAQGMGGAIYCYNYEGSVDLKLINCAFVDNIAEVGGAVVSDSYHQQFPDNVLQVQNCIFWGSSDPIWNNDGSLVTTTYSCVQGGWPGRGNIDADPLFVDPDNGDYHLSGDSPCIDAGCNGGVPPDSADLDEDGDTTESTPLDLDGEGRFFDDPRAPDTGCGFAPVVDMGAYELGDTGPQPCPGDMDGDRDVDQSDLGILLAAWGDTDTCDLDCDGDIDQADLGILLAHWGEGCP